MIVLIAVVAAVGVFVIAAGVSMWAIATYDRGKAVVGAE